MDDFLGAPAEHRVVAQGVFPHPLGGNGAIGENLLPDRPIDRHVLVRQEADQSSALLFVQLPR